MEGWITFCHRSFTRRKKESKEGNKKKGGKNDLVFGQYANAHKLGAKWDEFF